MTLGDWTLNPIQLAVVALLAIAYGTRVRTLRARGRPPAWWRAALFATGLGVLLVALVSPVHALGEEYLSLHMVQHLLLGDIAPLLLLLGLSGALLRPLLAVAPIVGLRVLANPTISLPLWAANLALWHMPLLYDAAVRHEAVHALEHASFFAAGIVVWLPVVETLPAPEWFATGAKLAYVLGISVVESLLGNVLLWIAPTPLYAVYVRSHESWQISPLVDQQLAGAAMLLDGLLVTVPVLVVLFIRLQQEAEARQVLLDRGVDPRTARRIARHRRWDGLPRS